jgi:hypothetical protein
LDSGQSKYGAGFRIIYGKLADRRTSRFANPLALPYVFDTNLRHVSAIVSGNILRMDTYEVVVTVRRRFDEVIIAVT